MEMPPHRCATCGALIVGPCPTCRRQRPTASARGYCSERWKQFRALQLSLFPFCAECERAGRMRNATDVDHILPVSGPYDARFLDYGSVQSLCHRCHAAKTFTENGLARSAR